MGEVFGGRYELVDVLAAGGTGTVWRAWDRREHVYRAAKVLRQSDGDSLLRFVRETSRDVRHPNVVAPSGWTGEDDRVLFTMPLVRGGSVATLLGDYGALPVGWALELFRQALLALVEVHRVGLVHRDVTPANLLLDATGRGRPHLMLSDFGAALQLGAPRLTRSDTVVGTPGYAAPEQLAGADPAATQDVYSVAVVLSQMLTGTPPPRAGGPVPLPRADATTAAVADLVDAMTDPDPRRRPVTALEALALLDAVPDAGPEEETTSGPHATEPVEVFDQVPPLPTGWTADGPERARRAFWATVPVLAWVLAAVGLLLVLAAVLVG